MDHRNRGYRRLFDGDLSVGLYAPLGDAGESGPSMDDELALAETAEELGFDAVWARDVPLYWPKFGEAGQVYDPWVYLSQVAARTDELALATGAVVLPLRHPLHVAKSAASLDRVSDGRVVVGAATGDRPPEFAAFGVDEAARGERFRESVRVLRTAWSERFPEIESSFGRLDGSLDAVPEPTTETLPLVVTGRARQSREWIAEHGDGWLQYWFPLDTLEATLGDWRERAGDAPYAQAMRVRLKPDPAAGMDHVHQGFAAGSEWLLDYVRRVADLGVDHLAVGLDAAGDRDPRAALERFADEVLAEL